MSKEAAKKAPVKKAPAKKAAAKPAAKKKERVTANGVVRPAANTKTGKVWEFADKISATEKRPATRAQVLDMCEDAGINTATGATQFGKWCKFNGVVNPRKTKAKKEEEAPATEEATEELELEEEGEAAADDDFEDFEE